MCNIDFTQQEPKEIFCPNCGAILGEEIYQINATKEIFCGDCVTQIDYDYAFDKLYINQNLEYR